MLVIWFIFQSLVMILTPLVMHEVEIALLWVVIAHIKILYKTFCQTDALVGVGRFILLYFFGKFYDSCLIQGVYELIY